MKLKTRWEIEDIIDLEVFLAEDKGYDEKRLVERDRRIYLEEIKPRLPEGSSSVPQMIRLWLEARRRQTSEDSQKTQGYYYKEEFIVFALILAILGSITGASVALSHLYYYGDRPINVMVFLSFTVLPQVLLLTMLSTGFWFRRHLGSFEAFAILRSLVGWCFLQALKLKEKAMDHISVEKRIHIEAVWGGIKVRNSVYGDILVWPLLILTQIFAVCFNLGVLAAVLVSVTFSNRAFGWATTLTIGPEAMHRVVQATSLPWSSLVARAHPNLQQVIESQIPLIGPDNYSKDALASWWPFLCYAVVFYGLIPRTVLLYLARRKKNRLLATLPFDHNECRQVRERMQQSPFVPSQLDENHTNDTPHPDVEDSTPNRPCSDVIVSRDLRLSKRRLDSFLQHAGCTLLPSIVAEIDCDPTGQAWFKQLQHNMKDNSKRAFTVAADAEESPTEAHFIFLKRLRQAIGKQAPITLLLLPSEKGIGRYLQEWKDKIRAQGDPYLGIKYGVCNE